MGTIIAEDAWHGRTTRIYVLYDIPNPDWEHDPDIADALMDIQSDGKGYPWSASRYYTSDPTRDYWVWSITRAVPADG